MLHLEDNENDQILVGEILRIDGLYCEMVAVRAGSEFESALRADGFDLILSDFAMPLMDGGATVAALRKIRPGLKVILASGSEKEMEGSLKQTAHDAFISKPFTNETLLETVHRVLAK